MDLREKGLSGEEKERKTEAEVNGQCKCGLEGEGTVGGGEGKDDRGVDLREKGLSAEEMHNRAVWRQPVRYIDPM